MADKAVATTKRLASRRQIEAAIQHYNNGAFECAITLAHAGENCIAKPGIVSLFERLKEKIADMNHNELPVWLKHGGGANTITIPELDTVVLIQRSISKFAATFDGITPEMKAFSDSQRVKLEAANKKA